MNRSVLPAIIAAIAVLTWPISDARAQKIPDDEIAEHHQKSSDQIYADAVAAFEAGDHQRALDLLDLAAFKDSQPRFVYQRILVLEAMEKPEQALDTLGAHRKQLAGLAGVGDLTALEQRLREASATNDDNLTERARDDKPESSNYIAWTLIGSGALAAGGGVTFLLLAESELTDVHCSGMYPEHERQDCAGVDAPAQISRAEFDRRLARVDSYRILGGSLLTLGVLAAGYGSYRLFSAESDAVDSRDDGSVAFNAAPRVDGGLEVQMTWQFY